MLPIIMKNICTVFGLGNFTKMPGTLGSIAGIFLGFILLSFFPIQLVIVFFIFLSSCKNNNEQFQLLKKKV